ncbi:unnamed protein product [Caenorhabditis angaria]|uniref:SAYSvFN domain-containing protein n=1 Tax=Caenorhabditis angaria TaxID=860376 RepID=A0A9P1IVW2_9PELO|nr:unnamed protein product [Caenorhabditis angaria]
MSFSSTSQKLEEFRKRKLLEKQENQKEEEDEKDFKNILEDQQVIRKSVENPEDEKIWTIPNWILAIIFVIGQTFAIWVQFGMVFFITFALIFIFFNTGKRKSGEISAYSVFNEQCESEMFYNKEENEQHLWLE